MSTPRQIADIIVCAVLDAAHEHRLSSYGERTVRLGDAVLQALNDCDVTLPAATPTDLDTLTAALIDHIVTLHLDDQPLEHDDIRERLRSVWNARGTADAKAIDERSATLTGCGASEPYRQHMRDAIKGLDR